MIEVLWIGRGGQGAFTAAKLLGAAYTLKGDNYYALAFPSFGPERRGAPVKAFTKLNEKPVVDRSQTQKADYIVILDETLYDEALKKYLKTDGRILVNSKTIKSNQVISFNGTELANKLHLPTVNTLMLGAVSALSQVVSTENLTEAIEEYMQEKIREKNKEAVLWASREVIA